MIKYKHRNVEQCVIVSRFSYVDYQIIIGKKIAVKRKFIFLYV